MPALKGINLSSHRAISLVAHLRRNSTCGVSEEWLAVRMGFHLAGSAALRMYIHRFNKAYGETLVVNRGGRLYLKDFAPVDEIDDAEDAVLVPDAGDVRLLEVA